jgi:RecA-family ATPase
MFVKTCKSKSAAVFFETTGNGEPQLQFVTLDHLSGQKFLDTAVASYLETKRPDILVIDCLSAYLGDSPTEPSALISFLRNGLTKLLRQFGCGCILVHHTPKTTNQKREGWNASEMQYAMAGDLTLPTGCGAGF